MIATEAPRAAPQRAWIDVAVLAVLMCVLFALPNYVGLLYYLSGPMQLSIALSAVGVAVGLTASSAILLGIVGLWMPRAGLSAAEIGWGRRTTFLAIVLGLVVAAGAMLLNYRTAALYIARDDLFSITGLRIVAALGMAYVGCVEEVIARGFLMARLHKAGVAIWLQVLASGAVYGLYHSLHEPASFPLNALFGCAWAVVYVVGRRSLLAPVLSHGLVNLISEPFALRVMIALVTMGL